MSTLSAWEETTVGDFAPFIYGKSLPERLRNSSGNVKVFGSNGIVGRHDEPLSDGPGIIIGRKGTVGAVHFSPGPFWPIDTTFYVLPDNRRDIRFTYYLLSTLGLGGMNSDTAVPGLNRNAAHTRAIVVPPLYQQRAIAAILGTLDDKIELNRRMNQILETMAKALFKSWFVDFEPFHDQGMQDSPLGPMPRGWRVAKLNDIAALSREGINPSSLPDELFDHYSIPAFDEGRMPRVENGEQIKSNKFKMPSNAILISKLNPRFPRVWFPTISNTRRSVCSTEFLVALPKENATCEYLYSLFCSHSFREVFSTFVTGTSTSHQRVRPEDLLLIDLVVSPKDVVTQFSEVSSPLYGKMAQNLYENNTLAAIRDTLLPKLLSGEIRVRDAEKFVEEAI